MPEETYKSGEITLIRIYAPYNQALKQVEREAFLSENAHARVLLGKDSDLSIHGNRVREDIICIPNKGAFLTKAPVTSQFPEQAVNAHKNRKEFYISNEQAERALEDSVQIPYNLKRIPINRFNGEEVTRFAFEQAYSELLREAGIKEMPIWLPDESYINEQDRPFARKLWFSGLNDNRSMLDGAGRLLADANWLLGVQKCQPQ